MDIDAPLKRIQQLERENAELRRLNAELLERLKELESRLRRGKRQTAPFSKDLRSGDRKKPGRKHGHPGAHQARPDHVDEEIFAPLGSCPDCGGSMDDVEEVEQFVVDLPEVRPHVTRIVTQKGRCRCCKRKARSTHPRQVSQATGAANVSMGPRALGLAGDLKHQLAVPYRGISYLFATYFGLPVTHGALVQSTKRLGELGKPTYSALAEIVRGSPVVHTDDTGWRIDMRSAWLWVFATSQVTLYTVSYSRGCDVVVDMLGEEFAGWLVSDGLPALDGLAAFGYGRSQCLGHLIRRARDLEIEVKGEAKIIPRQIKEFLQDATKLAHQHGQLPPQTIDRQSGILENRLDDLLKVRPRHPETKKLLNHMRKHEEQLLVCTYDPEVAPTNNLSEQQLRGAVKIRKIGGCNRSDEHAEYHSTISSVAQTARRNGATLTDFVMRWVQPRAGPPGLQSLKEVAFMSSWLAAKRDLSARA